MALERATAAIEADTPPALAALTARVSGATLGWVHRLKGRLARVMARVMAVRAELERFLDDDSDMRALYLTRRAAAAAAASAPPSPSAASAVSAEGDDEGNVDEAEDLLETYFLRLDTARLRLEALSDAIDATEDYLRLALDASRNALIALELLLGCASLALGVTGAVAGLFGMNLESHLEQHKHAFAFVALASFAAGGAAFVALLALIRRRGLLHAAG